MPLGKEVGLGPGHIVLDGDTVGAGSPLCRHLTQCGLGDTVGTQPPQQPLPLSAYMPIVAKQSPISATAELLYI